MVAKVDAMQFIPGQRWLSETEIEQGLGMVTQLQGRMVSVLFPVTGEMRQYAISDAPLARYQLLVDEVGQHGDGWSFRVIQVDDDSGVLTYHGIREDNKENVLVPESQLAAQVATNQPLTRILAGKLDRLDMYNLRLRAQRHLQTWQGNPAAGLMGARAELLPHQLYIAATVADRHQPRVLLADEVGLGKTIEAGLIMHRRLLTGRSERILIVVPDSLAHQWLVELLRRFNLQFSLFDIERCEQAAIDGGAVFASEQLVLVPQSLLSHPMWSGELFEVEWDLLVIDEAHQVAPEDKRFQVLKRLTEHVSSLLMLTATPEQAGVAAHFARLQLLDPDRFNSFERFTEEQANYRELAPQAEALAQAKKTAELDELLDNYGTGRVMFRNSRAHIGGFPTRHLCDYVLPAGDSLTVRFEWLVGLLKQHKHEKFVLICRHTETVLALHEMLRVQQGIHAAVFHEGLSLLERDRAATYFASPEDGCPILLCSEIGSEGRNFQFTQHLILFDLPRHPDLLEQRIGRLDRIGQQADIFIHVPVVENTAEQVLFAWYQAMQAFTQTNAVGESIFRQFDERVQELIDVNEIGQLDELELAQLVSDTEIAAAELRDSVEAGRDRLQELNAFRPHQIEALLEHIRLNEKADELQSFMESFWARFGVDYDRLDEYSGWLRPSDQMRVPVAGLADEGITVTFSREHALTHEDVAYLTWDHPFVQQALELLSFDTYGCTALGILKNRALPAGAWFIELTFSSLVMAPKQLVANEFYPRQTFRVLLDSQGRDLTDKVAANALDSQLQFIDKKQGRLLVKQLRRECQQAIQQAWHSAEQQQQVVINQALEKMQQQLNQQFARLVKLKQRNPMVRQTELDAIELRKAELQQAFKSPLLQLDSVRLIVNIPA
ncbi:SNF2-related protein [Pseudidiomarina woesei]|uniref:RNA polymerase-associated protein RapA n=1 Tax=Pseudidiomarina woesei TaxID=1381080 RepID=A0A0K6HAM2_9GAMM|nr:SNF2-related protein [Pseudidiomarina woesei]CUA87941.1 Superfamily II DNA or RNA helicase, SNF2 family [Pseudidiomarina woesei]